MVLKINIYILKSVYMFIVYEEFCTNLQIQSTNFKSMIKNSYLSIDVSNGNFINRSNSIITQALFV